MTEIKNYEPYFHAYFPPHLCVVECPNCSHIVKKHVSDVTNHTITGAFIASLCCDYKIIRGVIWLVCCQCGQQLNADDNMCPYDNITKLALYDK